MDHCLHVTHRIVGGNVVKAVGRGQHIEFESRPGFFVGRHREDARLEQVDRLHDPQTVRAGIAVCVGEVGGVQGLV